MSYDEFQQRDRIIELLQSILEEMRKPSDVKQPTHRSENFFIQQEAATLDAIRKGQKQMHEEILIEIDKMDGVIQRAHQLIVDMLGHVCPHSCVELDGARHADDCPIHGIVARWSEIEPLLQAIGQVNTVDAHEIERVMKLRGAHTGSATLRAIVEALELQGFEVTL